MATEFTLSQMTTFKIIKAMVTNRHVGLFIKEIKRRLYSDNIFYILRRDLTLPIQSFKPKIPLTLRSLRPDDIPKLLDIRDPHIPSKEVWERIRRLQMVKADIERGFVAVTQDDVPCHLAWLIDASQNDKLQKLFNGGILPLAQDEVLFEGAFTPEGYRNRGIQKWRVSEYLKTAAEFGRRWAYAFVRQVNSISLQNDLKMGFVPYLIRQDKWRRFHRDISFTEFHISVLSKLGFQKINPLSVMG